jgi:hypothetical protein
MARESNKKWLQKQIDRDLRVKAREKLRELRRELRAARVQRKEAMKAAAERCRTERLAARERARALRIRGLAELREATRLEREAARQACVVSKREARSKEPIERRRAELEAERKYQLEMRVIDRGHKQRRHEHRHATYIEKRAESDDEVRSNIDPSYWSLWQRIKRGIKATPRMSRTEAFLKYVEEHPHELLEAIEDKTDALVRELEERERALRRRGPAAPAPRFIPTPEYLSDVPF